MSRACEPSIPTDQIEQRRDCLEQLAESELPVSDYADRLLELLSPEEGSR